MPLIDSPTQPLPTWCEVDSYEIVDLDTNPTPVLARRAQAGKLVVVRGSCTVDWAGTQTLQRGETMDIDRIDDEKKDRPVQIGEAAPGTVVVHFTGRWRSPMGGAGVFTVAEAADPHDGGDPVWYPKSTSFDRHFHDCDEYWVVIEGQGVAVSEGVSYNVGPGACIVTGMGHHHDFPQASEPILAVFFETTLEGEQRRGHLWEHTHGPARPQPERV